MIDLMIERRKMKKVRLSLALTCMLLVCAMAVNLTGCVIGIRAQNLMDGIVPNEVEVSEDLGSLNASVTDFAIR